MEGKRASSPICLHPHGLYDAEGSPIIPTA